MADADVDSLMAELGIAAEPAAAASPAAGGALPDAPAAEAPSEVDALMAELGVAPAAVAVAPKVASTGPGRGRGRGLSSGPGAAFRGRGGASSGPGRGAGGVPKPVLWPVAEPGQEKIIGPAGNEVNNVTPDGKAIQWTGPQCGRCNHYIAGPVLNALDKQWHPDCFVCTTCHGSIQKGFLEHDGKPYCENDFNALFCPTCYHCKQPITDKCVTAGDMKFHPQHFMCTGCGKDLMGIKHEVFEEHVYCTPCYGTNVRRKENPTQICGRCKGVIEGEWVLFNNQPHHPEHFSCEECGIEFKGNNAREWEGGMYCLHCYKLLIVQKCGACNKPIKGRSITALGRVWHPEHFVCAVCHQPFPGGNFHEKDGKAYCEDHFVQEFGERCAKCNMPVAIDAVHFEGKAYHREHFCCHACDKGLGVSKKVYCWESKPMCSKCFGKLPEAVRKRIKKTAQEKAKAEKERKKSAKKS